MLENAVILSLILSISSEAYELTQVLTETSKLSTAYQFPVTDEVDENPSRYRLNSIAGQKHNFGIFVK